MASGRANSAGWRRPGAFERLGGLELTEQRLMRPAQRDPIPLNRNCKPRRRRRAGTANPLNLASGRMALEKPGRDPTWSLSRRLGEIAAVSCAGASQAIDWVIFSRVGVARRLVLGSPVRRAALNTSSAALVNQGLLIVSGSLSARILGPADRGHAALIALVPSVLSIAGSFGLASAVVYFVAQAPETTSAVLSTLRRALTIRLILLTTIHLMITILWLAPNLDQSDRVAAFIALSAVPATFFTEYGVAVLQGHQRFLAFSALIVAPPLVYSLCVAALYASGSGDLVLVVLANTVASAVTGFAAVLLARACLRRLKRSENAPSPYEIRRFARKSYFGQVAPIESFRLDQLAVGAMLTPTVLGYYTVASAFTNLSRFLGASIGHVLAPYIASLPKHRQTASLLRGLIFTAGVCALTTFALVPTTDFLVPVLFGDAFGPAIPLSKVLLIAGLFLGVRRAVLPGLQGLGHPEIGSYSELVALLVFAGALPIALQSQSGMGVAVVFLISAVVAMASIAILFHLRVRRSPAPDERGDVTSGPNVTKGPQHGRGG